MDINTDTIYYIGYVGMIGLFLFAVIFIMSEILSPGIIDCKIKMLRHSEIYCYVPCNLTNGCPGTRNEIHNKTEDDIAIQAQERQRKLDAEINAIRKMCFDAGKYVNFSLDLKKDYNLSCDMIKYLNDHFVLYADRRDAGGISGSYSGFLSSGSVKGNFYQWVYTQNVATGKLMKHAEFHLDCNNSTFSWDDVNRDTTAIEYYSEADFILYYTKNCIEGK